MTKSENRRRRLLETVDRKTWRHCEPCETDHFNRLSEPDLVNRVNVVKRALSLIYEGEILYQLF